MARTVIPLNNTKIKQAKQKDKAYTLSDGKGLQLLIKPNGSKLWEFYYISPITLKRRKTSFETYPKVKLVEARAKREDYQNLINQGIDPIDYYQEIKRIKKEKENNKKHTINNVIENFLMLEQNNRGLKEKTISLTRNRLKMHFVDYLQKKEKHLVSDITYKDIINILDKLEATNKLNTLSRVRQLLVKLFKYAYVEDIIKNTDLFAKLELKNYKRKKIVKNNPTLIKTKDIKKLYRDMLFYRNNLITRYLLIFTIHTAQRQGSIVTAKWCDIDIDNKIWSIPKENMKMGLSHTIPISDILMSYIVELKEITGDNVYLFPNSQIKSTRNRYPHISTNTVTSALRFMGYTKEQQTAHGFRAMFKSVCKEHQESDNLKNEFVERILSHKTDGEVEAVYNRANNIEDMRIIVNWWSRFLDKVKG